METLVTKDPENTGWQRDLTVSYERIGDILNAEGRRDEAMGYYRKIQKILEALLNLDSQKCDQSVGYGREP